MTNQKKIQIWILTRDRLEYFVKALLSAINQKTHQEYEIIVSDNSEGFETSEYMKTFFPNINYIRRYPSLTSEMHFKLAIEESRCDYLVLFHDDDILDSSYISKVACVLDMNPGCSAVGTNARLIINGRMVNRNIMGSFNKDKEIISSIDLWMPYFSINNSGAAAFPSYMYRKVNINSSFVDHKNGGKYSDVSMLYMVLKNGSIFWLKETLIYYRVHNSSDSAIENIYDRLSLLRFFNVNEGLRLNKKVYSDYRFLYWKSWWRNTNKGALFIFPHGHKQKVVAKFLVMKMFELIFTRKILYQKIFYRLNN